MSRTITASSRMRQLVTGGTVPQTAQIESRRRRCSWQERGLEMQLSLEPLDARDPTGVAPWTLFVSPPGVLGLPHESGGAGTVVAVQPAPGADAFRASWVSGADFERLLQQARHFVADGNDLCRLLLERSDVVRGELTTWHYQRFAARVVKALLLAPHLATGKPRNALWLSCTAGRRSRSHPPGGRTSSRWPAGGLER